MIIQRAAHHHFFKAAEESLMMRLGGIAYSGLARHRRMPFMPSIKTFTSGPSHIFSSAWYESSPALRTRHQGSTSRSHASGKV
jgi:hypothetical protein